MDLGTIFTAIGTIITGLAFCYEVSTRRRDNDPQLFVDAGINTWGSADNLEGNIFFRVSNIGEKRIFITDQTIRMREENRKLPKSQNQLFMKFRRPPPSEVSLFKAYSQEPYWLEPGGVVDKSHDLQEGAVGEVISSVALGNYGIMVVTDGTGRHYTSQRFHLPKR